MKSSTHGNLCPALRTATNITNTSDDDRVAKRIKKYPKIKLVSWCQFCLAYSTGDFVAQQQLFI